jgi:putative DNA primase/helicase
MIDGCLDWQKSRLSRPKSVMAATGNYFEAQDIFKQWLDEECDCEPGNTAKSASRKELFASWTRYARNENVPPGSPIKFGENLRAIGAIDWRSTGGIRLWKGVQLRRPFAREDD